MFIFHYVLLQLRRALVHTRRMVYGLPQMKDIVITENLFLGGQFRPRKYRHMMEWGVTGIVNMRLTSPKIIKEQQEIDYLHLPTRDQKAPQMDQLKTGVAFMKAHIDKGGKVYVHCKMGEGRGPTMAAAYLISQGMNYEDSVALIKTIRPFIRMSNAQIKLLRQYEKTI